MLVSAQRADRGREVVDKPDGGFVFIPAAALVCLWTGFRRGCLEFLDVRVAIAACESAQRVRLAGYEPRAPDPEAIRRLTESTDRRRITAAIRRLAEAGIDVGNLSGPRPPVQPYVALLDAVTVDLVVNHRRRVPVPRRLLVYLARCSRPAVLAVALAHLLRGLYYRNGKCVAGGTCKASWAANVFGLDLRSVKAARAELVRMGWLKLSTTPQYLLNRFGVRFMVNMQWSPPGALHRAPLRGHFALQEPPPERNGNLSLRRFENQNRRTPGVNQDAPCMRNVTAHDLRDPRRLAGLYRNAIGRGMVRDSESDRLAFFGAAEHALAHGERNPPGLFVSIVRAGLWGHISQAEEDRARVALARLDYGPDAVNGPNLVPGSPNRAGEIWA